MRLWTTLAVSLAALMAVSGVAACGTSVQQRMPTVSASASATASASAAELDAKLDAAVEQAMKDLAIPGALVGISVPGTVDYVKAFGSGDQATDTPMSLDDHVRIGSVTKTFTGTAILQLVDQKRVQLTDPVSKYVAGVPSGDKITLQMLGDMRSGLFNYSEDEEFVKSVLPELSKGPTAGAVTAQQLLDISFKHPLNFEPGTKFEYSNTNAVLLGMVVEKVSGQPLADYFQRNIFTPSKLTQTSYPSSGEMPTPYAHGYTTDTSGAVVDASLWNPAWANAAGAIISTYADMKIWASELGKGSLLAPETQKKRLEKVDQAGLASLYRFAIFENNGWLGHNGSIPGYTSVVMSIPDQNATLVVFTNTDIPQEHAAGRLAEVVTTIATPDHIYARIGTVPQPANTPSPAPTTTR